MDVYFEQYKPASSVANYLLVGSKSSDVQTLGFELEHFVVEKESLALVPYEVVNDPDAPSVSRVLEQLKHYYQEAIYENDTEGNAHLFGMSRDRVVITLEPGAQLEVSIGPAGSVKEIEELYHGFRNEIDSLLDALGLMLLERGYHPTRLAQDIPLIPKLRYKYMDEYFTQTGNHGICMMRATASTQVSIDYTSEADALAKFRVANALGPLFAFITDNSPLFETEVVGAQGGTAQTAPSGRAVPFRMARMICWDDVDPTRSMVVRGAFDDDFSFLRYAETLIESPGIFLPEKDAQAEPRSLGFTTFKQALPDSFIDEALVLHILSIFFFDTRIKTYLELRQADAMPLEFALAYTALISGLFYNPQAIEFYSERFLYIDSVSVAYAKSALRKNGFEASVYGRPATEWFDEMITFAVEGLAEDDRHYLAPLINLVNERMTVMDVLHEDKR